MPKILSLDMDRFSKLEDGLYEADITVSNSISLHNIRYYPSAKNEEGVVTHPYFDENPGDTILVSRVCDMLDTTYRVKVLIDGYAKRVEDYLSRCKGG